MTATGLQLENLPQALYLIYIRDSNNTCQMTEKGCNAAHNGRKILGIFGNQSPSALTQLGLKITQL